MKTTCKHDSNNDGDCHKCDRCGGCPLTLFRRCEIDAATMQANEVEAFKRDAQFFEYTEFLGTIRGYRHRDGRVLVIGSTLNRASE